MNNWIIIDDDYEMAFDEVFKSEHEAEKFLNSFEWEMLDYSIIELEGENE